MGKKIQLLKAGQHSCFGALEPFVGDLKPSETPDFIDRPSLLVYAGKFQSMDGEVEINDEILDRLHSNHNSVLSKVKRLTTGQVPMKLCPPIQLDHSVSARDTVGRLVGDITKAPHQLEDGSTVNALFGTVRVMGRENVEKVLDGRWANLSLGADLSAGKLSEVSITPFPAAFEASMLAQRKQQLSEGKEQMNLKKHLMENCKMSEEEADKAIEKMKQHLKGKKMSEEDVEKKLSGMTGDEYTSMSKEMDEEEKKLAEKSPPANPDLDKQETKEPEHKMSSETTEGTEKPPVKEKTEMTAGSPSGVKLSAEQKADVIKLVKGFKTGVSTAKLKAKEARIQVRLQALRASAKITPAEVKKMDLAKLSASSEETIEAVLKSYEDRQPVVITGLLGTAKAMSISQLAKDVQSQQLFDETLGNMPSLKAYLSKDKPTKDTRLSSEVTPVPSEETKDLLGIFRLIDGGKAEEAKTEVKKVIAKLSAGGYAGDIGTPKETETNISALAETVNSMQNQVEELMKLVGPILGVDGSDL